VGTPERLLEQSGRYSLVDGIPFHLPVACVNSPVLMAVFGIDALKAQALLPGNELYALRLWKRGLLVVTVINYLQTTIGKYIEFSIAIACTHGSKPAPRLLPGLFMGPFGTGQYVVDLPVSTEISVKGGKGIWGMPKHQANPNYVIGDRTVSSQYDLDGQLAAKIEILKPAGARFTLSTAATNYCSFRGMLFASSINFSGKAGFSLLKKGSALLTLGEHPRMRKLKELDISPEPLATAFIPQANGILDDHMESWFLSYPQPPVFQPQGMDSVVDLGLSQEWLAPPTAPAPDLLPPGREGR
jgi:Acetoacetate decarboxylase (ADC)